MPSGKGYQMHDGRYADVELVTLVPNAPISATGAASSFEMGGRSGLRLALSVSAVSGTSPTLDVTIQTSQDAISWRTLGTFTQASAVGSERKSFGGADRFVRASYTLGGSGGPSVTASVAGEAV